MKRNISSPLPFLEWVTGLVLVLVLAALVWMVAADQLPASWRLLSLETEIVAVLGLLTAALFLVSILALLHTESAPSADSLDATADRLSGRRSILKPPDVRHGIESTTEETIQPRGDRANDRA